MSSTPGTSYVYIAGVSLAELIWKSIFAEDPMSREAGMRYRRLVLEPGGTQDPLDMLEKLLGKRPKVEDLCN
jgi:metallopeptidase MepB